MTHGIAPIVSLLIPPVSGILVALTAAMKWPGWWLPIALVVGCAFPACVMAAGLISGSNIWPVGGLIWFVLTMPLAYLGAGLGEMIGRTFRRRPSPTPIPAVIPTTRGVI